MQLAPDQSSNGASSNGQIDSALAMTAFWLSFFGDINKGNQDETWSEGTSRLAHDLVCFPAPMGKATRLRYSASVACVPQCNCSIMMHFGRITLRSASFVWEGLGNQQNCTLVGACTAITVAPWGPAIIALQYVPVQINQIKSSWWHLY